MWTLGEHQVYALEMMDANPAMGIFYDMGTGKTAIALMHIYRRVQKSKCKNALIVCPASLVDNWKDNIEKMMNFEGVTKTGLARMKEAITISSFQKMYKSEKLPNGRRKLHLRPEVDKQWDILICDESHYLGAHNSLQSKAAYTLAQLSKERYILTGTPVHGGGGKEDFSKLYGQMRIIVPGIWNSWREFCNKYVTHYDFFNKPDRYDVASCHVLMENHAIVCRIEQVIDMPDKTDTVIQCPLKERKIYKDVEAGAIEEYNLAIDSAGNPYIKLLQVCSGSLKTDENTIDLKTSKDDVLENLITSTTDKVVIFCNYRASVDRCIKICRDAGRKAVQVDGRAKQWKEFQYGDADAIVCQYQSGGAGLDLFASHTMIFYEPNTSAEKYSQARARIYRKGQTNHCLYYILVTPGTVEVKTWQSVRNGESVSAEMLHNWAVEELGEKIGA